MNIQPTDQKNQSITDDQELAKVLAGVNQNGDQAAQQDDAQAPMVPPTPMPDAPQDSPDSPAPEATTEESEPASEPEMPPMPEPSTPMPTEPAPAPTPQGNSSMTDLNSIKQAALGDLRPLVDKLDVSPEEKFDTYLLLLRSTDDRDLIAPAYESAHSIVDEARRAQALLDIIKEIDFLSQNQAQNN